MSSTRIQPGSFRVDKRTRQSAILLACAGLLVIAGSCAAIFMWGVVVSKFGPNAETWGSGIYAPLSMLFLAACLGIAGLGRFPAEGSSFDPDPAQHGSSQLWLVLAALILIHGALAFMLCRSVPGNTIDTFTFQRDACKKLLQGVDPFGATQADIHDPLHTSLFYGPGMVVNGRVQVGFQYPPLTLLVALPGYLLGDIRYSYIVAVTISALLLFAVCPTVRGVWIASVLLFSPLTYFVENRCWTEPLVLMALTATMYAAVRKRWWLPVALGLFLATKQYNFLALPFIGYFVQPFQWKAYWKLTGLSLLIGVATVLPFAFWNLRGLWHDLVLFHLAQPFRQDSVSFAVLFPWMMRVGPLILVAFIAWAVRTRTRKTVLFAAAYGVALLLFFLTSKQAFANYYFLVAHSIFMSTAALPGVPMKSTGRETSETVSANAKAI